MISIVIPVYNSERSIKILLNQIAETLEKMGQDYEVIPVCDSSPDEVWGVLETAARDNPYVHPILLAKNAGQQQATLCGIQAAKGDVIVTIDDDLEFSPRDIEQLWDTLNKENADIVYGSPPEKKHKWLKRQCSKVARLLIGIVKPKLHLVESYRMIRSTALPVIDKHKPFFLDFELIKRNTKVASCPVDHQPRMFGTSNYSALGSLSLWFTFLFKYSWLPIAGIGFFLALAISIPQLLSQLICSIIIAILAYTTKKYRTKQVEGYQIEKSL